MGACAPGHSCLWHLPEVPRCQQVSESHALMRHLVAVGSVPQSLAGKLRPLHYAHLAHL